MPPYLPPYTPPAYDQRTGLNTGDLGFMTLPVERTSGGFRNNIFDPSSTPFAGGPADPFLGDLPFNPFLQGYMSGGKWNPYLPEKITLGQRRSNSAQVGNPAQWINGQRVNVGSNNLPFGTNTAPAYNFATSSGTARESPAAQFDGFHFGQVGQPGYRFIPGSFSDGKFYSQQPEQPKANPNLGVFQEWNPAAAALIKMRGQPSIKPNDARSQP